MSLKSAARRSPSSVSSGSSTSLRQVTPLKLAIPSSSGRKQTDAGRHYNYEIKLKVVKTNLTNFDRHLKDLDSYRICNPTRFDTYKGFRPTGLTYNALFSSHELCAASIHELIGLANPSDQRALLSKYQKVIDTQVNVLEGAYDYVQPLRQHVLDTIKATGSPPLPHAASARITPSSVLPGPSTSAP